MSPALLWRDCLALLAPKRLLSRKARTMHVSCDHMHRLALEVGSGPALVQAWGSVLGKFVKFCQRLPRQAARQSHWYGRTCCLNMCRLEATRLVSRNFRLKEDCELLSAKNLPFLGTTYSQTPGHDQREPLPQKLASDFCSEAAV